MSAESLPPRAVVAGPGRVLFGTGHAVARTLAARPRIDRAAVSASQRRTIVTMLVQAVPAVFAIALVSTRTDGPVAVWIALWWLIDLLAGGNNVTGANSRSLKIPLAAALIVTGACAFVSVFTPFGGIAAMNRSGSFAPAGADDRLVFLEALWILALVTVIIRALVPLLFPKRTLRIVSGRTAAHESRGRTSRFLGDLAIEERLLNDGDAFVGAVLGEVNARDVELVEMSFPIDAEVLRRLSWELRNRDVELLLPLFDLGLDPTRVKTLSATNSSGLLIAPSRPALRVRLVKRAFDVVMACGLLVVLLPLLVAVAIAIMITMPGPVFYRQERVGRDAKPFKIVKFRSMIVDADAQLNELLRLQGSASQPLFKVQSDPRITRLGSFLRRSSIDEIPQLFNVIGGSMSLVGPRPQRDGEVALYSGSDHHRLGVRPGMTGLWQVSGRSDLGWEQAREFDLYYAHNWNLQNDLKILLRTFGAVVRAAGAR